MDPRERWRGWSGEMGKGRRKRGRTGRPTMERPGNCDGLRSRVLDERLTVECYLARRRCEALESKGCTRGLSVMIL